MLFLLFIYGNFCSCSGLGEVKTILYIQIYAKLTINHRVHFFNLLNTGSSTSVSRKRACFVGINMMKEKNFQL